MRSQIIISAKFHQNRFCQFQDLPEQTDTPILHIQITNNIYILQVIYLMKETTEYSKNRRNTSTRTPTCGSELQQ